MKHTLKLLLLLVCAFPQVQVGISPKLLKDPWPARWIAHPTAPGREYGVYHFRKNFNLTEKPENFVIHISADNRYIFYVNGHYVGNGPARGDLQHWRFETIDIAPWLTSGKNVLAAVVWNFGQYIPWAQITNQTGFICQGNSENAYIINTDESWKVIQNQAYQPIPVDRSQLPDFTVVGPGEQVDGSLYPWGWTQTEYDDSAWLKPGPPTYLLQNGSPRGVYWGRLWWLIPRTIPFLEEHQQRISTIARSTGINASPDFLSGQNALTIPANTNVTLLLDQTYLTTAYPELLVSGGKDSQIKLIYAEALYDQQRQKGNRNDIADRTILGYYDLFLPDGGQERRFRTLWFRTYRYIQVEITTDSEPVMIHDLYAIFTAYPFKEQAYFKSSDPSLQSIWNVGWRTARLCAGETYFDCPYYEQLQYVGDTRIQALISLYVAGDDRLMRKAIQQFDDSRIPDGLTASRHPSHATQIIPPYSLFWIAMVHDYWMHRDDSLFVKSFLPGIQSVLGWYERQIGENSMLGPMRFWNFVDWARAKEWHDGVPPGAEENFSAIITLQYVYNLQFAAELFRFFGKTYEADRYQNQANLSKAATLRLCWDAKRALLADTPEKRHLSQHANIMAILVDLLPEQEQQALMERILGDADLTQCTFYYRYYLIRALIKAGMGDHYLEQLQPWRDMLAMGLTTFAEKPEPTRSDCHAWSASPNYDLLATVCGIMPDSPGFKTVRIEPHFGPLTWIEGVMPHPKGDIVVNLRKNGKNGIEGEIELPPELTGIFIWNGETVALKSGKQKIHQKRD
jgi:alpha-L-rhamnosidase